MGSGLSTVFSPLDFWKESANQQIDRAPDLLYGNFLHSCLQRLTFEHYLFQSEQIQSNYAALYFKRRGLPFLLDEAVAKAKIDAIQAYAE
jgi:hypothetical protein